MGARFLVLLRWLVMAAVLMATGATAAAQSMGQAADAARVERRPGPLMLASASTADDDDGDTGDEPPEIQLEPDAIGQEVELGSGGVIPEGSQENPDSVAEFGTSRRRRGSAEDLLPGYPKRFVARPITLVSAMSELSIETPVYVSPFRANPLLEARYGVTSQLELALAYGVGTASADGFTSGKALSLEVRYLVFEWLAAQAGVPMLLDPYAMGITLGVPMKFRFGDNVAITFGQDLVSLRLWRFVPVVSDPLYTQTELVAPESNNTVLPLGDLRLVGGIVYQLDPTLTLIGETGLIATDFARSKGGVPLLGTLVYSPLRRLDLAARIGFFNLERATQNFALTVSLALRL